MTIMDIVLILIGCFLVVFSFVITERVSDAKEKTSGGGVTQVWGEKEEFSIKSRVKDIVSDKSEEVIVSVEDRLCHLSNEKIMEFKEYSDEVMESIKEEHKQAVFLYNMLNEKENETKVLLNSLDKKYALLSDKVNKLILKLTEKSETSAKKQVNSQSDISTNMNHTAMQYDIASGPIVDNSKQGAALQEAVLLRNGGGNVATQQSEDGVVQTVIDSSDDLAAGSEVMPEPEPEVKEPVPEKKKTISDKINELNTRLGIKNTGKNNKPKETVQKKINTETVSSEDIDNILEEVADANVEEDIDSQSDLSIQADMILEQAGITDDVFSSVEISEIPAEPVIPEVSDTPEVPDIPEVAEDLDTSESSMMSDVIEMSDIPVEPVMPEMPDTPEVPDIPEVAEDLDTSESSMVPDVAETSDEDGKVDTAEIDNILEDIEKPEKPSSLLDELNANSVEIPEYKTKNESVRPKSQGMSRNEKILAMHNEGKSVIDISRQLGIGQGEVKLVIDLFKGA